jgi:hypothetical protein
MFADIDIHPKTGNEKQENSAKFLRMYGHTYSHKSALSVADTSQARTTFAVVGINKTRLG